MTHTPGRRAEPLTLDTPESNKTGRSLHETVELVASALPDDDATPETAPSPKKAPATPALPALPEIPELEEVRRVYGEQGVMLVQQEALREHLVAEHAKTVEAIPEWSNPDVMAEEKAAMRNYATVRGWTEADLAGVTDHRTVVTLRDAWLHHKALSAPKAPKPEAARHQVQEAATDEAAQRFLQSHSMRDAARLIEHLI